MDARARQFTDRSYRATGREARLLCLFNALYVLQGNNAYKTIAELTGMTKEAAKQAVDSCHEDYEGPRTVLSDSQLDAVLAYLESLG